MHRSPCPSRDHTGRVGGDDELEARREAERPVGAGDGDLAGLHGLAQGLENGGSELGASSRKSTPWWDRLTAPGRAVPLPPPTIAAIDAPWCGATKGAWCESTRPPAGEDPEHRGDRGDLKGLFLGQPWQQARQPFGEHRLPGAGWSDRGQVVTPAAAMARACRASS